MVNRGIDGDFDPDAFRHLAFYNEAAARIEMHLVAASRAERPPRAPRHRLALPARDSIWTESSYKFTRHGVEAMLAEAGLSLVEW